MTTNKFQFCLILFSVGLIIGLSCATLKSLKDIKTLATKIENDGLVENTATYNISSGVGKLSITVGKLEEAVSNINMKISAINTKVSKTMLDAGTIKENISHPQVQWTQFPPKIAEDPVKTVQKNLGEMLDESKLIIDRTQAFKNILGVISKFKDHKAKNTGKWNQEAESMFRSLRETLLLYRASKCVTIKDGKPEVNPSNVKSLNFCMMILEEIDGLLTPEAK